MRDVHDYECYTDDFLRISYSCGVEAGRRAVLAMGADGKLWLLQ